jgi:hypothetical protein
MDEGEKGSRLRLRLRPVAMWMATVSSTRMDQVVVSTMGRWRRKQTAKKKRRRWRWKSSRKKRTGGGEGYKVRIRCKSAILLTGLAGADGRVEVEACSKMVAWLWLGRLPLARVRWCVRAPGWLWQAAAIGLDGSGPQGNRAIRQALTTHLTVLGRLHARPGSAKR